MNQAKENPLLPLVTKLTACPAQDNSFSKELLRDAWERFQQGWRPGIKLSPAVIAALVVYDSTFALLLNDVERAQMRVLSELALDRFEQKSNPPNKLGKSLAAILEIST